MTDDIPTGEVRAKQERSPSYPFISLEKAVMRARAMGERHKREPARLPVVGETWGYGPKSSGLAQTVGALIQFGLLDDVGSGQDRKVQLTDLARRILFDARPGVREQALKDAALRPRIMAECFAKWGADRPSDRHCISELEFDLGFNRNAAQLFLKSYDETVSFAALGDGDRISPDLEVPLEHKVPSPTNFPAVIPSSPPRPAGFYGGGAPVPLNLPLMSRSVVTLPDGGQVAIEFPSSIAKSSLPSLKMWLDFMYRIAEDTAEANERAKGMEELKRHGLV